MYTPPAFREERSDVLFEAMRAHPLATLVTHGTTGLNASLLPFNLVFGEAGKAVLQAHLAKANGQLEDLRGGNEALVIFHGPQAYVSPSWYATKNEHGKVVPTWNYVVVEARGVPELHEDAPWLLKQIEALTDAHEGGRAEPWNVSDAPEPYIASQIKGIVGLEIPVASLAGKWKASQNQPMANRIGVAEGLSADRSGCAMASVVRARGGLEPG